MRRSLQSLQGCRFDPRIAWKNTDTAIAGDCGGRGWGTPCPILLTGAKKFPTGGHDYPPATDGLSEFH